jgi:transcriptional regulator with XRE-family HTH domain
MAPKKKGGQGKPGARGKRAAGRGGDAPHPIDVHVGSRVRKRRTELGMSQEKLGDAVQLTFQQIQKYERGANRIGASRLFEFSQILDVPIGYFYEDPPADAVAAPADAGLPGAEFGPEVLTLVKTYYRIQRPDVRHRLYELVKAVARESD